VRLPYNAGMSILPRITLVLVITSLVAACNREPEPAQPAATPAAQPPAAQQGATLPPPAVAMASLPKIDPAAILDTTKKMSSDKFQGRGPGTVGEDLTVGYLEMRFKELGLQPGNPDGTYIQKVPVVGITGKEAKPLVFTKGSEKLPLTWKDDVVAWSKHVAPSASVADSDVVFAG
jgi:hypothetical protein